MTLGCCCRRGWDWADSYAQVGKVWVNGTIQLSGNNDLLGEDTGPHSHFAVGKAAKLLAAEAKAKAKAANGAEAEGSDSSSKVEVAASSSAGYPIKPKARLMVVNALSELDAPVSEGE